MTFYEMTRPEEQKIGFFETIQTRLSNVMHAMQYARMLQAMNSLSDDQLDQIGVARSEVPQHAHACIYGK